MKKGISIYFGFKSPIEERIKKIKDAGFTHVITTADKQYIHQNETIKKQMQLVKKYGLQPSSLHMSYKASELPLFWKEGKAGDKLMRNLIKDVKIAKKYNFHCVVAHFKTEKYSKIGEERLRKVLKYCEKYKIFLAVENINCPEAFFNIFKKIKHEYLKLCYDSGHNNAFDKSFDYLTNYSDKLVCLHLHDNNGLRDEHTLNKYGTIDWKQIAEKLAPHSEISLDYELFYLTPIKNMTEEKYLKQIKKQADELEKYINLSKNK